MQNSYLAKLLSVTYCMAYYKKNLATAKWNEKPLSLFLKEEYMLQMHNQRIYGRYIQRHFRYSLQYENRERPYTRMNVDINGFLPFQKASEPNKYGDKPFW